MDSLGKIVTKFAAKRPNTCHGLLPHCTNEKSTPPNCPLSVFVPDFCLYFSLLSQLYFSLLSFHNALTHPCTQCCKIFWKKRNHKHTATKSFPSNVTLRPLIFQTLTLEPNKKISGWGHFCIFPFD